MTLSRGKGVCPLSISTAADVQALLNSAIENAEKARDELLRVPERLRAAASDYVGMTGRISVPYGTRRGQLQSAHEAPAPLALHSSWPWRPLPARQPEAAQPVAHAAAERPGDRGESPAPGSDPGLRRRTRQRAEQVPVIGQL
jgi:hypothetical protein